MLFNFSNIFVTFQTKINKTLRKLMNFFCVIYLNDILIYFKTKKKHWRVVRLMLKKLWKFKLFVNLTKCVFIIQSIEFLNFIISNYDVVINFKWVKNIRNWLHFISLKKLQMFLNFANFYRRFVEFYAKITRFLTKFLKRSKNEKQNELFLYKNVACAAFVELIEIFTQIFMLIHFDSKN